MQAIFNNCPLKICNGFVESGWRVPLIIIDSATILFPSSHDQLQKTTFNQTRMNLCHFNLQQNFGTNETQNSWKFRKCQLQLKFIGSYIWKEECKWSSIKIIKKIAKINAIKNKTKSELTYCITINYTVMYIIEGKFSKFGGDKKWWNASGDKKWYLARFLRGSTVPYCSYSQHKLWVVVDSYCSSHTEFLMACRVITLLKI